MYKADVCIQVYYTPFLQTTRVNMASGININAFSFFRYTKKYSGYPKKIVISEILAH